jgi:hypothetical protein
LAEYGIGAAFSIWHLAIPGSYWPNANGKVPSAHKELLKRIMSE